jgi:ribonuclease VapC
MLYILDSSAVLALLQDEAGAAMVEKFLPQAAIATVNYTEIISKLLQVNLTEDQAQIMIHDLFPPSMILPFTHETAKIAAGLYPLTKGLGLSLGDRACLATAMHHQAVAVTADRSWGKLKLPIKIKLIR